MRGQNAIRNFVPSPAVKKERKSEVKMRRGISIDDLPERYREQVRRQTGRPSEVKKVTGSHVSKPPVHTGRRREPNKTEAEYNRRYLGGAGKYEAVTLRLPGGSRYTPDWQSIEADGRVTFHEVKGSYRFGSQGRAATAFRECAAAFPEFDFIWAVRQADGSWSVKKTRGGQNDVS